jgi:hypothetical protein
MFNSLFNKNRDIDNIYDDTIERVRYLGRKFFFKKNLTKKLNILKKDRLRLNEA